MTAALSPLATSPTAFDAVFYAWERWNELPGEAVRANDLQDAIKAWGDELGLSWVIVRRLMVKLHRHGQPYDVALAQIRELAASTSVEEIRAMVRKGSEA